MLVKKLKEIFAEHIGIDQGITAKELLRKLYGEKYDEMTKYQRYFIHTARIEPAMRWLRAKTHYFIISARIEKDPVFFIVKDIEEFSAYKDKGTKAIDGWNRSIDRCEQAVTEKWHESLDG